MPQVLILTESDGWRGGSGSKKKAAGWLLSNCWAGLLLVGLGWGALALRKQNLGVNAHRHPSPGDRGGCPWAFVGKISLQPRGVSPQRTGLEEGCDRGPGRRVPLGG